MRQNETIKTVIIDDEAEARDLLSTLLGAHPEIEIAGTACDAYSGLSLIEKIQPDLVFLDIQMPRKTGFDLVAGLRERNINPVIVFVTAYDEYAIRAFNVAAFDYLLKPVDPEALADTIKRYSDYLSALDFNKKVDHLLHHLHHDDRIKLNTRAGFLLIDPGEIIYAEADGNYTLIHLSKDQTELVTMNIGTLHTMLPSGHFDRISRFAVINRAFLYRVDRIKRVCELRRDGVNFLLEVSRDFIRELTKE
jgi:two-component system LytT family response regulator